MDLSVLIPARNEKYLQQTIDSVLANAEMETEVVVVLDGYWPDPGIKDDPRVVLIHHTEARGQRPSVNEAARVAKGKYLMKLDAHCAVGKGFDRILIEHYKEGEVHLPRMYNLDVETFTPKKHKKTDYMYIGWAEKENGPQLRSLYYGGQQYKEMHSREKMVDETMGMMGPCRFMSAKTYWDLGGCDEDHGHWGSEGIEWACKAWLSGGRLMVNKHTWFAHWFRGGSGPGFPYPISQAQIDKARNHAENMWLNDKWEKQKRPFRWLLEKFNPPTWEHYMQPAEEKPEWSEEFAALYQHIHRKMHYPTYEGIKIQKLPNDLWMYSMVLWDKKPEVLVEIGTRFGGATKFFQDQMDKWGGKVITINKINEVAENDPRIEYIIGDSISEEVVEKVRELTKDKKTMFVIDGNHHRRHVKWEIHHYGPMVTPGQYMVLEDCYIDRGGYGPKEARDWLLSHSKAWENVPLHAHFLHGVTNGGWLLKK